MAQGISSDLVGKTFEAGSSAWTWKDVALYALGVGAKPDGELEFVYEQKGPKVLPTYGVVAGMASMGGMMGLVKFDLTKLLHGEQSIVLHRPIPPNAKVTTTGRISEVWDKGKAAVLGVEGICSDKDGPLFTTKATVFIRDAGGFGGERGPSAKGINEKPDREPDYVYKDLTRPEQGAIYRLSGDLNPIHIDPNFAKMGGFQKPFLHGLCTYGFVGRAILHTLCGSDPARFGSFEARFSDQVYPGDEIITKMWIVGDGEAIISAETNRGNEVLSKAKATFKPE